MKQLFFNKKDTAYYIVCSNEDINIRCCKCKKIIPLNDYLFIHKSYSKIKYIKEYYCENCIKDHRKRIYDEFITAKVSSIIPPNSVIIPDFPPTLKNSEATVFSAAISNDGISADTKGCKIMDHCKVSNNPDRNIMPEYNEAQIQFKKREMILKGKK